jgi:hypothetical protein
MGTTNAKSKSADEANPTSPVPQPDFALCSHCSDCTRTKIPSRERHSQSSEKYQKWTDKVRQSRSGLNQSWGKTNIPSALDQNPVNAKLGENHIQSPRLDATPLDSPRKPRRSSLRFAGKLPSDWTAGQQERLQYAVAEVANRSKMRCPGQREMQMSATARKSGDDIYGLRSFPNPLFMLLKFCPACC